MMNEEKFFKENEKLIWHVIYKHFKREEYKQAGMTKEDAYQIGSIGLLKAIRNFEPELGYTFATYAIPKIYGEIRKEIRDHDNLIKLTRKPKEIYNKIKYREIKPSIEEVCKEFGVSKNIAMAALDILNLRISNLDSPISSDDSKETFLHDLIEDVDSNFEQDLIKQLDIKTNLSKLNEKERLSILLALDGKTQRDIGKALNISQVHVSRLVKKGIKKLREQELEEVV